MMYKPGADLSCADLEAKNLSGMNLKAVNLYKANLRKTNLCGANLQRTNLRGANLQDADLTDASLLYAEMHGANVHGAILTKADLSHAFLFDVDLRKANLEPIRQSVIAVLQKFPSDRVVGLLETLRFGMVHGRKRLGRACCLKGTLANLGNEDVYTFPPKYGIELDRSLPEERWFLPIQWRDTSENSQIVAITVEWIEQFLSK